MTYYCCGESLAAHRDECPFCGASRAWQPTLEDGSCDHEFEPEDGAWPRCVHCDAPAPDDYHYGSED